MQKKRDFYFFKTSRIISGFSGKVLLSIKLIIKVASLFFN